MKNNHLVLLDLIIGLVLLPLCILAKFIRRFIAKIFPVNYQGTLVIKFLGAGNFLAIKDILDGRDVDVVTAKSNEGVLESFSIGKHLYIIDDRSLFKLAATGLICFFRLSIKNYYQVINLETESKFAKFLTAITSAKILSGVSNVHKSYIDYWLYDRYLVNPVMLNKKSLIEQLEAFDPVCNMDSNTAIVKHQEKFEALHMLGNVENVVISPTCSNTDHLRRLGAPHWERIIHTLVERAGVKNITAIFPNEQDPQYADFLSLAASQSILNVRITTYSEFVGLIDDADLLITIDSQALHVRQQFNKAAVAIYGPTSPFGVSLKKTTFPITRSLVCSPCTHKYLRLPCGNDAPCMNFSDLAFNLLDKVNR